MPDGGEGKEAWATKRKLEKVFESDKAADRGFNFNNTLMIDSDYEKVRDYPLNSIVVEPYSEEAVTNPSEDPSADVLIKLREFLLKLLNEADDIQ